MKYPFKTLMVACLLALTFSMVAQADDTHQIPPDTSSAELQKIKSLEGRWSSVTSMFGKENEKVFTEYQVTAGGSAVLEKIFPGTPQEMISVYYDDENGKLTMTHYCIMRNRPTLKLASATSDTLKLDVKKVEGLKSKKDPSMGGAEMHFKDKDHFETTCKGSGKDKENEAPMTMEWARVK